MRCPICKGENILLIEYAYPNPKRYDGVSEIKCHDCKKRYGRFCETELKGEAEQENKYCQGGSHK